MKQPKMPEHVASAHAKAIIADAEALAAYEVAALDVPEEVASALEAMLRRDARRYQRPGDVSVIRGDE